MLLTGERFLADSFYVPLSVSVQLHTSAFLSSHSCAWLGLSVLCALNPSSRLEADVHLLLPHFPVEEDSISGSLDRLAVKV